MRYWALSGSAYSIASIMFRLNATAFSLWALILFFAIANSLGCRNHSSVEHSSASTQAATAAPEIFLPYHPRAGHSRPLIAVVGESRGTEVTDFVIPYGVLSQSGQADVIAVGIESGPIQMHNGLKFQPQATIAEFDRRSPEGADYVIVPAVVDPSDTTLANWVRAQAGKGAITVGVCDGVWVLADAGMLKGHRATGHWHSLDALARKSPDTTWVRNRRYVVDGPIVTTTGVTASIPVSLALVQAIGGIDLATRVAGELGVQGWSSAHDSNQFGFSTRIKLTAARNIAFFWSHEDVGIPVTSGVDEIALALTADVYSRTMRTRVLTVSESGGPIRTRRSLMLIPDLTQESRPPARMLHPPDSTRPVQALDQALSGVATAYGQPTADFINEQMETETAGRDSGQHQAGAEAASNKGLGLTQR